MTDTQPDTHTEGGKPPGWRSGQRHPLLPVSGLYSEPGTIPLLRAGRYLGIYDDGCYAMVKRDTFPVPVIKLGNRFVVTRASMLQLLDPTGVDDPRRPA